MKIDYLPTEDDKGYHMFAYVNTNKNEVKWNGVSDTSSYMDAVLGTEYAQFQVWRKGKIVIAEAIGWYDSNFHFRFECTDEPNHVLLAANEIACLMERARE